MKLLQIVYGRLSDISYSCLCLSTKVIFVFKNTIFKKMLLKSYVHQLKNYCRCNNLQLGLIILRGCSYEVSWPGYVGWLG